MRRFLKSSLSVILALTISLMGMPSAAFAEAAEEAAPGVAAVAAAAQDAADGLAEAAEEAGLGSTYGTLDTSTTASTNTDMDGTFEGLYHCYGETFEYHYEDAYFRNSSFTYNTSLSTMSFNMAMAAFGSATGTTDEDYANADSNVKALMAELGFTHYEVNDEFLKTPGTNTIGCAMGSRTIKDENGENRTLICIAIRGGNYQQEWGGNATIGKSGEAKGFGIARDTVVTMLNNYLIKYEDYITDQPKIWIVGFSRASAVTNLTGNYLNYCMECYQNDAEPSTDLAVDTTSLLERLGATQEDLFAYGFEVPAGGCNSSKYLCEEDYDNLWNIVDPTDLVPLVAPAKWGFYRYGNDVDPTAVSETALATQLKSISDTALTSWKNLKVNTDGGFRRITASVLKSGLAIKNDTLADLKYKLTAKSDKANFLKEFINYTAKKIGSRSKYVDTDIQDAAAVLTGLFFSGADMGKIVSVAKKAAYDSIDIWKCMELESDIPSLINSGALKRNLVEEIDKIYNVVIDALRENDETRAIITDKGLDTLEDARDGVVQLVVDLLLQDTTFGIFGDITYLPTALYYADELISAHDVRNVLAYLRSNDSVYDDTSVNDNYAGAYFFTLANSADGGALSGVKVTIEQRWYDDTEGWTWMPIGTWQNGALTYNPRNLVSLSTTVDGTYKFKVKQQENSDQIRVTVEGTSSAATDVYVTYANYNTPGTDPKTVEDPYQNVAIPVNNACSFEMLLGKSDSNITSLTKTVPTVVRTVKYDETAEGHYVQIDPSEAKATLTVDGVDDAELNTPFEMAVSDFQTITVEGNPDAEYYPDWAFTAKKDANGDPIVGDNGAYTYEQHYSGTVDGHTPVVSFNSYNDLKCMGQIYYVVCTNADTPTHSAKVYALDNSGNTVEYAGVSLSPSNSPANTGEGYDDIMVGETITVSVSRPDVLGYALAEWVILNDDGTRTDASELPDYTVIKKNGNDVLSFSFTMGEEDIALAAIFTEKTDEVTVTLQGGWDIATARDNTHAGITLEEWGWDSHWFASITSGGQDVTSVIIPYIYQTRTTVSIDVPTKRTEPLYYFLGASEYLSKENAEGEYTEYEKFASWSVTQEDGTPYVWPVDFGVKASHNADGDTVFGDYYGIDGCTDSQVCLDLTKIYPSAKIVPTYEPIEYDYSVTLSDGTVVTGKAQANETVTITNSEVPEGFEFDDWDVEQYAVSYVEGALNTTFLEAETAEELTEVETVTTHDATTLTFTMPNGNVEAKAVNAGLPQTLTLTSTGLEVANWATVNGEPYTEAMTINAGDTVSIDVSLPEGYRCSGGSTAAKIKPTKVFENNTVKNITFTMPGQDTKLSVEIGLNYHKMRCIDATACYYDEESGAGEEVASSTNVTYGKQLLFKAGTDMFVEDWIVEADEEVGTDFYTILDNGDLLVTMPDSPITVEPVYETSHIYSLEIGLCETLVDGYTLPTDISITNTSNAYLDEDVTWWCDGYATEATEAEGGSVYEALLVIDADDNYAFDKGLTVTVDNRPVEFYLIGDDSEDGSASEVYVFVTLVAQNTDDAYTLVVHNGSGSGDYAENAPVSVVADEPQTGTTFTGFTVEPLNEKELLSDSNVLSFGMPAENVLLTANYTINKVGVAIDEPTVGETLPTDFTLDASGFQGMGSDDPVVFYTDGDGNYVSSDTVVEDGQVYTVNVVMSCGGLEGYTFDEDCTGTINGHEAKISVSDTAVKLSYSYDTHDWGSAVITFSSDGKKATATWTCKNDSSHVITKDCEVVSEVTKPATCVAKGRTTYTAWAAGTDELGFDLPSRNGVKVLENVAMVDHTYGDWMLYERATPTVPGTIYAECQVCGYTIYDMQDAGWYTDLDGSTYLVGDDGLARTGWVTMYDDTYYFDTATGNMAEGWVKVDGTWYYTDPETGELQTGWTHGGYTDGRWYYLDPTTGAMATGWTHGGYTDGRWYFMAASGKMVTGWTKGGYTDGRWYYMKANGRMTTNAWVKYNNSWYFLKANGRMATGWIDYKGKSYYCQENGKMATGKVLIDGKYYTFSASGVWDGLAGIKA